MSHNDIDIELYRVFYHVAKQLSFSKAAEALFISQSAVSQNIKSLEKKLDTRLFIRSTKKVTLTGSGTTLLKYIEPAIHLILSGQNHLLEPDLNKAGMLHIGASDTICRYFLLDYLEKYHRLYPNIHIQVTNRTSIDCVSLLASNQVDLIVINMPNDYITDSMEMTVVKQFQDVFVANDEYNHLFTGEISVNALKDYPVLMLERNTTTSEFLHKRLNQLGVDIKPEVELGSIDLLMDMASIGLGISFIPNFCLRNNPKLTTITLTEKLPPRHMAVVTNKNAPLTAESKRFIELML